MQLRYLFVCSGCDCHIFDDEFNYKFYFNSNFVRNYLSRAIRRHHYFTDGTYKMIGVELDLASNPHNWRNNRPQIKYDINDSLMVIVPIDKTEFDQYNNETILTNRYEFYLSVLERGYHLINDNFKKIPIDLLLSVHDEFRSNNYKNEWLLKRLKTKEYGLIIELKCFYTTFDFRCVLTAFDYHTNEIVAEDYIYLTGPDEDFYDYVIKSAKIEGDKLIVYGFFETKSFIIDLPSLAKGHLQVQYRYVDVLNEYYQRDNHIDLIKRITW